MEPPKEISLEIMWDKDIQSWDDFKHHNPNFTG
jgi:hypothetical protein